MKCQALEMQRKVKYNPLSLRILDYKGLCNAEEAIAGVCAMCWEKAERNEFCRELGRLHQRGDIWGNLKGKLVFL